MEFTPRANQCCCLGVQDVKNSKPKLIIKDEYEDGNLGNMENYIL